MSTFFEKLKRGMGIEEPLKEVEKVEEKPKKRKIASKKLEIEEKPIEKKLEMSILPPPEVSIEKKAEAKEKWLEAEGELAIDVYQTETDLVIQSAVAGVKPENLDISMERDVITIKGIREKPFEEEGDYFIQECYWGPFSREVITPVEVDPDRAEATMKDGILTIRIPKILREKRRRIKVII